MRGILVARVVAVIAKLDTGKTQVSSGYLLDANHILTARHCTLDKETGHPATGLSVIRADDGASATVTVSEESAALDLALLAFSADAPWGTEVPDGAVTFGKVSRERSAWLNNCEALGYPLWQAREFGNFRDIAPLRGKIRTVEGMENQRLVLRDPELEGVGRARAGTGAPATGGESAWGGLSGAAVFYEGLLLGVIVEHHPRQGETALQIQPVDAILTANDDATLRLGTALGITEPGALHPIPEPLPTAGSRIVLSRPLPAPRLPDQYVDRVEEQREIADLLGKEGARVAIYGLPGVGKTALAAKIAKTATAPAMLAMDTVLWADLGPGADAVDVLRRWCQDDTLRRWHPELDAEIAAVTDTPREQPAYLRELLSAAVSGKRVLFVLDAVGSSQADIEVAAACVIDDENCRYLLTTISAVTASHLAAHGFAGSHLGQMAPPEAEKVLERYADGKLSQLALSDADREHLLLLGNGLPLGLMVLGRFLSVGLAKGGQLPRLMRKLRNAEALVQERDLAVRLRAGGEDRGSIDAILMAHWIALHGKQKNALQAAAVFREKPHTFDEAAWACILEARLTSSGGPEESEELAQQLGTSLGRAENDPELGTETEGLVDISSLDEEDDEYLPRIIKAVEDLEPRREALMETGLIEQPVMGEPSFTMHSSIAAFVRTVHLVLPEDEDDDEDDEDDEDVLVLDPAELTRVHGLAARYYRGWLGGYQEHAVESPLAAAYRFENRQWLNATLDLCYHLREAGSEDEALLMLTTLFFDTFWWWGELVPYPPCEELLRIWQLAHLGRKATRCLRELRKFKDNYPSIDLGIVPSHDRRALPSGYQDGTEAAHFHAVRDAVTSIRNQVLGGVADDAAAERDRARLRTLTAIYLGEADRVTGQFEEAERDYQEALRLLKELGADGDSDDWMIPYVHSELADLYVRAGTPEKALQACVRGVRSAVDDTALPDDLGDSDIDHEVLGWLWLAAGSAHWQAGRLPEAWRSYAWACFHACAYMLWPELIVRYERPGAQPQRVREFGIDDYCVMYYKLNLATMLDRLGELWRGQRRTEACDGIRVIRETLAGGPDRPSPGPDEPGPRQLEKRAAEQPEAAWEDCRDLAWQDTGLAGLALPLIPWNKLTGADGLIDRTRVEEQRLAASDLAARLRGIWASSKWTLREGPGQVLGGGLTLEAETDLPIAGTDGGVWDTAR